MTDDDQKQRTQRRRPIVAKEWQLAILKKLQSESRNPTEEQRSAAAAETGLDEKWVRSWFTRQRSKLAARNRKAQPVSTVPTLKLQLCPDGVPHRRSASTPVDPTSCLPTPLTVESSLPSSPSPTIPRSPRLGASTPNDTSQNTTLVPHTTTMPTYSRDPLCNRYPDFSQFFRPQVHERFHTFEFLAQIGNHQLVTDSDLVLHTPVLFQSLFNLLNPPRLGGFAIDQNPPVNLQPQACPVAFSMRLVDLLVHPSPTRYPLFLSP